MYVGLDLGTTNVKALLVAADGRVIARGSAPVSLQHVGHNGVEQDIEEIWQATLAALSDLAEKADVRGVRAIGISSQGGALQFLDEDDIPCGPVISWLDGRGKTYAEALTQKLGTDWFRRRIGVSRAGITAGQLLRVRDEKPSWYDESLCVAYVGDVIAGRLCGRRAHDPTSLALGMLLNPAVGKADVEFLKELDLNKDRLPDLLSCREPAGRLQKNIAGRTGLPAGLPVSPAVHDQYASALGLNAVNSGDLMLGTGTAWVLLAVTAECAEPVIPQAMVCSHVVKGLFGQMLSMVNGGSSFHWATEMLGLTECQSAELDALMEGMPPGCDGLRFLPFLAAGGIAGISAETAGGFRGLRLSHGSGHLLRAVVEGLCLELARYRNLLIKGRLSCDRLTMGGGGTKSRVTPQIIADATGVEVTVTQEPDVSAFGAAVLARGLVESDRSLPDIREEMALPTRVFRPGPAAADYTAIFREYLNELDASILEE